MRPQSIPTDMNNHMVNKGLTARHERLKEHLSNFSFALKVDASNMSQHIYTHMTGDDCTGCENTD